MPQATDTSGLVLRGQEGETQVVVGGLSGSNQWQAVPGRACHQVGTTGCLEHIEEPVRLRQGVLGGPAVIQVESPVGQAADIYADRARVEAYDAGHDVISSWPALFLATGCLRLSGSRAEISSRAISAMASASSTRSFREKSRATQTLCSLVLKLPTPNAPNTTTFPRLSPSSFTSIPSIPSGGTAFRSTAIFRDFAAFQAARGTICTPAGPELRSTSTSRSRSGRVAGSLRVTAWTWTLNRALMNCRAFSPCSGLREVMVTSAPSLANKPAARWPTGPVPARMRTFFPLRSPSISSILTTAATAVVFEPLESSMMETENGANSAS